jgi:hypothetical protein
MKSLVKGLPMQKSKSLKDMDVPAGSNRLSSDECKQMIEHVDDCPSCHAALDEFLPFVEQLPAGERDTVNGALVQLCEEGRLRERFIERARAEGIRFSHSLENRCEREGLNAYRLTHVYRWVAAGAVLGMIMAWAVYHTAQRGSIRSAEAGNRAPEKQVLATQVPTTYELESKLTGLEATLAASRENISRLQDENAAALQRIGALEKDLLASRGEKLSLQQSLDRMSNLNAQLSSQYDHNAQLLAQTRSELENARARGTEMEVKIVGVRAEADTLSEQLKSQTATIDRERKLLAAGRDITDLIGARNLHIVDVHDLDARGKKPKSFGRIFYTEGKSLAFYAYDLDERKLINSSYSFKVWGERLGEPTSVRELGILYTDNRDQKRWILKVDDPQQLAEIDSVFVTLQHHHDNKPLGQRILFAFLGGAANHP